MDNKPDDRYPHNFNHVEIRKYVENLIKINQYDEAILYLDEARNKYYRYRDQIDINRSDRFSHLKETNSISPILNELSSGKSSDDFINQMNLLIKMAYKVREEFFEQSSEGLLKGIWKNDAEMSIEKFLETGVLLNYWDENQQLIELQRGSSFGSGKTFIASLSIALKGHSINENIGYRLIGEVMCKVFNIEIKDTIKDPYKLFQSGNPRYIRGLKTLFKVT